MAEIWVLSAGITSQLKVIIICPRNQYDAFTDISLFPGKGHIGNDKRKFFKILSTETNLICNTKGEESSAFSLRKSQPEDLILRVKAMLHTKLSWTAKLNAFQFSGMLFVKYLQVTELLKYSEHTEPHILVLLSFLSFSQLLQNAGAVWGLFFGVGRVTVRAAGWGLKCQKNWSWHFKLASFQANYVITKHYPLYYLSKPLNTRLIINALTISLLLFMGNAPNSAYFCMTKFKFLFQLIHLYLFHISNI